MRHKNKLLPALYLLLVGLILLLPMQQLIGYAENTPKDLGNLFTFKELTVNGQPIADGSILNYNADQIIQLSYDWRLPLTKEAVAGDYAFIVIPSVFKLPASFPPQDITITHEGAPLVVGQYSLDATTNILRFVFNQNIENLNVENGIVGFGASFKLEAFQENVIQRIAFNDLLNKTFELTLRPQASPSVLTKAGALDAQADPKWIDWTFDILNPADQPMTALEFVDPFPAGLAISADQLSVKHLTLGYNGTRTVGAPLDNAVVNRVDSTLTVALPDLKAFAGYRITLRTPISDDLKTSFANTATLNYQLAAVPKVNTASHTITGFTRSALLEKTGQAVAGSTTRILWQLDINKPQMAIPNASLQDMLPTGLSLRPGTLTVYPLTRVNGQWVQGTRIEGLGDSFPLQLGDIAANQAYRVTYETDVQYSLVNSGNYQKSNAFTNAAQLLSNGVKTRETAATVTLLRADILKKSGSRANYASKIAWTITVNEPSHGISGASLTDTLSSHVALDLASLKIYEGLTGTVQIPTEGKVTYDDGTRVLNVNLGDITGPYRIVYDTTLLHFDQATIPNPVTLTGVGINGQASVSGSATINDNTYTKTETAIQYANNTISWRLDVDPRREPIQSLTITDTFPQKGLALKPETLAVTHNGIALVKDVDYTLAAIEGDNRKGFVLTLLPARLPITSLLRVTYDTTYSLDSVEASTNNYPPTNASERQHRNTAVFTGTTLSGLTINRTVSDVVELGQTAWINGAKSGKLISYTAANAQVDNWISGNTRAIEWQAYFNFRGENLGTGVTLTDSWSYPGSLKAGSLKLVEYTVSSNGTRTLTGTVLDASRYTVTQDPAVPNQLSIAFANDFVFNKRYALVYVTEVPQLSLNTYSNTATITVPSDAYRTNTYTAVLTYQPYNSFLTKSAAVTGQNVYLDDELQWSITLNDSLSVIEQARVEDTISPGHILMDNTLQVFIYQGATPTLLTQGLDYTLTTESIPNVNPAIGAQTKLTLAFQQPIKAKHLITYKTVVTATTGSLNNTVKFSGENAFERSVVTSQLSANQFSFIGGSTDPLKGNLTINKVDQDTQALVTTGEATFELYYLLNGQKRVIGGEGATLTTVQGALSVKNLSFRTYYLRELSAPPGYHLDAGPTEIVLSKTDTSANYNTATRTKTITIANRPFKGSIVFTKHGAYTAFDAMADGVAGAAPGQTYPSKPQSGAVFELYKQGSATVVATATSSANGEVRFDAVPYGSYDIKEKTAPAGYQVSSQTLKATVLLEGQQVFARPADVVEDQRYTLVNDKRTGSLVLTKVDAADANLKLANAVFGLYRVIGSGEVYLRDLTTDAQGQVVVTPLEYGSYVLRETAAPSGYKLNSAAITFTIADQGVSVPVTVTNEKTPVGQIQVTKRDALSSNPLAGTRFELRTLSGELLTTGQTNAEGKVLFSGIVPGNYQLHEIQATEGYLRSVTPVTASVLADQVVSLTITNQPYRTLKLLKVDTANTAQRLAGAVFQLLDSQGAVVATKTTDAQGEALFTALALGTYQLKEATAPAGYLRSDQLTTIVLQADSPLTLSQTLYNAKAPIPVVTEVETSATTATQAPTTTSTKPSATVTTSTANTGTQGSTGAVATTGAEGSSVNTAKPQPTTTVPPNTVVINTPVLLPIPIPKGGTADILQPPQNGKVEILPEGKLEYTPSPGFTGKDQVTLLVSDPNGETEELTFDFEVEIPLGSLNDNGALPQTGEHSVLVIYLLGTLLIAAGAYLRLRS